MLRIKLEQGRKENTTYRIKINNEIIDQGILFDKSEFLEYKGVTFDNSNNDVVSISCTNFFAGRELYIKAIEVNDNHIIAGDNFKYESIVSGCCEDIQQIIEGNYNNIVNMDRAGSVGEWIFKVSPDEEICFWNDDKKDFTPCVLRPTSSQKYLQEVAEFKKAVDEWALVNAEHHAVRYGRGRDATFSGPDGKKILGLSQGLHDREGIDKPITNEGENQ